MTTSDSTMKTCTKCKQTYPATSEFFPVASRRKCGLRPRCRSCHNADSRAYTAANPEKSKESKRKWAVANPDKDRETRKIYKSAHREKLRKAGYLWQCTHKETMRNSYRKYRATHPEKTKEGWLRRRARKVAAEGWNIPFDEKAQFKHQHGKCYYCQCKLDKYHIDHVIPLSRGGSDHPDNKVLACPSCNLSKHAKLPHEWTKGGRLL